jgi:hypothetical protein
MSRKILSIKIYCLCISFTQLTPFQNSILFSSAHSFFSKGLGHYFTWGPDATFHGMARTSHIWRLHNDRRIYTFVDVFKFKITPFSCLNLNSALTGASGRERNIFQYRPWSNWVCIVFNFIIFEVVVSVLGILFFLYFL